MAEYQWHRTRKAGDHKRPQAPLLATIAHYAVWLRPKIRSITKCYYGYDHMTRATMLFFLKTKLDTHDNHQAVLRERSTTKTVD